jgi:hypothetical protein
MQANIVRFPRESEHLWKHLPKFDPQHVTKTRWLIKSFLAERSIHLIYGERGSFKSTLLLAAASAVSNGQEFLGMKSRRRRVLYLDYENPDHIIKARNDDLNLNLSDSRDLKIWNRFGHQQPPRPGDTMLEELVRECAFETGHGPWLIFDSWASLLKAGEGGEFTGQIAPIYAHLRKLADVGASVTVLDHSRKYETKTVYGGLDKEAKVDSIHSLSLYPNRLRPTNPIVRVESWLKRFAPRIEGVFAFEVQSQQDRNGNCHLVGLAPALDPERAKLQEEIALMLSLIRQNPNSGQEALAKAAATQGLSKDRAISLLKEGIGKHWNVQTTRHGKHLFSPIQK